MTLKAINIKTGEPLVGDSVALPAVEEAALRKISDERGVYSCTQIMYDADTRGGEWATWCCTDSDGAMRGVRITATREEVAK